MKEHPIPFSAPMVRAILDGRKTQTRRIINPQPPEMPTANCHPRHAQKHPQPYLDAYCSNRPSLENPRGMSEEWCWWQVDDRQCLPTFKCQFGKPGDHLWVREAWRAPASLEKFSGKQIAEKALEAGFSAAWCPLKYDADGALNSGTDWREWGSTADATPGRYRHARFMPRWASRLNLQITGISVERLQEITEDDAKSEGAYQRPDGLWTHDGELAAGGENPAQYSFRMLWNALNGVESWKANPWVWVISFRRLATQEMAVAA